MRQITEDFLLEIFAICFKEQNFFHTIKQHLKSNYILDADYQNAWNQLVNYYNKKKTKPTIGSLIQKLTDENIKGKHDGTIAVFLEVKMVIIPDPDKILAEFEEFIIQNKFIELYQETGKVFNEGKREIAFEKYIKGSQDIKDFSLTGASFDKVFGDFFVRTMERAMPDDNSPIQIPTMMMEIDEATDGGLYTKETELWLGDSGVGKSKLLVGRGIASARSGYNVLHVQLEGSKRQCLDNLDACWTGQLYSELKKGNFNDSKSKAYSAIIRSIGGEVYVKASEQFGKVNTTMIRNWVIALKKELASQGKELHHLVLDYMDLVEPTSDYEMKFGSGSDGERLRQIEVVRQLKNIAVEFNILVTTATQSSDVPKELSEDPSFVLTRNFLGSAKRKVEAFSYFFTINQTPEERKKHIVRVHVDKFRDYVGGFTWRFKQSLKNSRFYDRIGTANLNLDEIDEEEAAMLKELEKEKKKTKKS